jgi:effector-binding domain-containing protein
MLRVRSPAGGEPLSGIPKVLFVTRRQPGAQSRARALPGGLAATATHTGPIAKIGDTHQAVCEWSKANGYRLVGPRWEIYGDPDPSSGHFDVQVFWSLVTPDLWISA